MNNDGLLDAIHAQVKTIASALAEDGPHEFQSVAREHGYDSALEWFEALDAENEELRCRVAELEEQIEAISDIGREKSTKEEKIAAIVTWAQRQAADEEADRVLVKVKDIIGCTGVSRRYAYDLLNELPDRHEWLLDRSEARQYGEVEQNQETKARGLVVDLEQLHSDEAAVNKFTTRSGGNGVKA